MQLSLSLWCAFLIFVATDKSAATSTSTSTSPEVPWFTLTSTRSCSTQPATVFIYTSGSSTFLLPQPGPKSALTLLESDSTPVFDNAQNTQGVDPGLPAGTETSPLTSRGDAYDMSASIGTTNALTAPGSLYLDPSATPSQFADEEANIASGAVETTTEYFATPGSNTFDGELPGQSGSGARSSSFYSTQSANTGGSGSVETSLLPTSTSSIGSRPGLGAGLNAGSGPRSGTDFSNVPGQTSAEPPTDASSRPPMETRPSQAASAAVMTKGGTALPPTPALGITGSKCPLPSTVTVSASASDPWCNQPLERTVTSYVTSGCPLPENVLAITRTIVKSGPTVYTNSKYMTRQIVTYTTSENGSTIYVTSLAEQTARPSSPEISHIIYTTRQSGSNIERTVTRSWGSQPETITVTSIRDGSTLYDISVIERTVQATDVETQTIILTSLRDGSTIYDTYLVERTAYRPGITRTLAQSEPTVYLTSIIERTITVQETPKATCSSVSPEDNAITYTATESGSVVFRTSYVERTASPSPVGWATLTYTQVEGGSTIYRTSVVERTATPTALDPVTMTYLLEKDGSTEYRTSIVERTATPAVLHPVTLTFTEVQDGSTVYRTSVVREQITQDAVTYTTWEGGSTVYLTSLVQQSPSPVVLTYTEVKEGSTIYSTSVIERTPQPLTVTYTTVEGGSVAYRTSFVERTWTPDAIIRTLTESGPTVYLTSIIERTRDATFGSEPTLSPGYVTRTLYENGSTIYETSLVERTISNSFPVTVFVTETETLGFSSGTMASRSTNFPGGAASTTLSPLECPAALPTTIFVTRSDLTGSSTDVPTGAYLSCPASVDASPVTSYIYTFDSASCPSNGSVNTLTVTEFAFAATSQTSFLTNDGSATLRSAAAPTSAYSIPASTIYSCPSSSSGEFSATENASAQTVTATLYETLGSAECPANLSIRTVTSFIYETDSSFSLEPSQGAGSLSPPYTSGSELAVYTVTSFIYGPTITASNELMVVSTTLYDISTVTEITAANCSFGSTGALSVQTVTSVVYPLSCDYQYTFQSAPEITITTGGSTVTVYASTTRTRTITPVSTIIGNASASGSTDGNEPTTLPGGENEEDEESEEGEAGAPEDEEDDTSEADSDPTTGNSSAASPSPIVANATALQQQGTASDPFVVAQVVSPEENPPIAPNSNTSFLLVTFGTTSSTLSAPASSTGGLKKRQASQQPLVYNATAYFNAVAGGVYNLSASAAMAQKGNTAPNCAITICADSTCGPATPLTHSFSQYTYTFNSPNAVPSQIATFSITCTGQAYVGLDNVRVESVFIPQPSQSFTSSPAGITGYSSPLPSGQVSRASSTSSPARRSIQTVTTSILRTVTTTAFATQTLTQTESNSGVETLTTRQIEPTTRVETATRLQNVTISDIQTLTSRNS